MTTTQTSQPTDDEFARYLASYLKDHEDLFVTGTMNFYLDEEKLYKLIREFRQELP